MDEAQRPGREVVDLRGNQVLRLDGVDGWWRVESGSVALFGVELVDGQARGRRRFFVNVGPGEGMFGLPPVAPGGSSTVIAVALEQSRLVRAVGDPSTEERSLVESWVRKWTRRLGRVTEQSAEPDSASPGKFREFQRALSRHALRRDRLALHERPRAA